MRNHGTCQRTNSDLYQHQVRWRDLLIRDLPLDLQKNRLVTFCYPGRNFLESRPAMVGNQNYPGGDRGGRALDRIVIRPCDDRHYRALGFDSLDASLSGSPGDKYFRRVAEPSGNPCDTAPMISISHRDELEPAQWC
jgi:hypothetical protein